MILPNSTSLTEQDKTIKIFAYNNFKQKYESEMTSIIMYQIKYTNKFKKFFDSISHLITICIIDLIGIMKITSPKM